MGINFLEEKQSVWNRLKESDKPIILYGMGNGADKVLDECARLGINISGVFASDDFVRGQSYRGFTVKRLSDFEKEYENFVVAVAFATQRPDVIDNILTISKKHETYVPCVPVFGNEILNEIFLKKYENQIIHAYSLLADEQSKKVFSGAINFQFSGKLHYLFDITTEKDEAFNNILKLKSNEHYLDLGAYRGDTIEEFLKYTTGNYKQITAFEPDKKTFKKLSDYCRNKVNITALNKAIGKEHAILPFSNKQARCSAISESSNYFVEAVSVDEIISESPVTYIKADIEGMEYDMLCGATETIKKFSPKLNIAAYHKCKDIFSLVELIHSINKNYKIYLRKHPYIPCWDLNIYASV